MGNLNTIKEKVKKSTNRKFNDPIIEEKIQEFETRFGVALPKKYRLFLLEIANGEIDGDKNNDALFPLGTFPYDMHLYDKKYCLEDYHSELNNLLHKPFPYSFVYFRQEGDWDFDNLGGFLYLMNAGCASYWVLIVTGEKVGDVWMISEDVIQPCSPSLNFLEWYEMVLDGADVQFWDGEELEKDLIRKIIDVATKTINDLTLKEKTVATFDYILHTLSDVELKKEISYIIKEENGDFPNFNQTNLQSLIDNVKKKI